jgi:geranylgeranyl diphosphate synthase type I
MIDGQAVDLSYQVRRDITAEDVLEMSARKTGALIGCAASIGAVLAGADPATCAALHRFGLSLGIAFQAVDDILGTWGDPEVTGKDVGSDMRRRKLTLPLAVALSREGAEAEELRAILAIPGDLEPWHVNRAIRLVEACGGRDWTESQAKREFDSAIAALESVRGSAAAADLLRRIAEFSVARAY